MTDLLAGVEPGEDDPCDRVVRREHALVVAGGAVAERREADSEQPVLGPVVAAPVAAVSAGARVVVLAGQRLPGQALGVVAPQLDHVPALGVDRDAPVEAVATEVGEVSAAANVGLEGVEHPLARVLGVGAGDHRPVARERRGALGVEVVVGEQVDLDPDALEEAEQDQVLREPVRSAVLRAAIGGAKLGQRPAAAIAS